MKSNSVPEVGISGQPILVTLDAKVSLDEIFLK